MFIARNSRGGNFERSGLEKQRGGPHSSSYSRGPLISYYKIENVQLVILVVFSCWGWSHSFSCRSNKATASIW